MPIRVALAASPAAFALPKDTAGLCLHYLRTRPGITRSELQRELGLPQSTAHRLLDRMSAEGLITFGAPSSSLDLSTPTASTRTTAASRATTTSRAAAAPAHGRPSPVVNIDGRSHLALGAHIGKRSSHLVLTDLAGRTIATTTLSLDLTVHTPLQAMTTLFAELSALTSSPQALSTTDLLGVPRIRSVGLAFSADIAPSGQLDASAYQWPDTHIPTLLNEALDKALTESLTEALHSPRHATTDSSPLATLEHLTYSTGASAMAGMELAFRDPARHAHHVPSILYVYAREVLSYAWIINATVHQPRVGHQNSLVTQLIEESSFSPACAATELPLHDTPQNNPLGITHLLQVASNKGFEETTLTGLLRRADSEPELARLLDERAQLLARVIDIAVQVTDPAEVVLAGETFATDPARTRSIARYLTSTSRANNSRIQRTLKAHPSHHNITLDAARTIALHPLWQQPLGR